MKKVLVFPCGSEIGLEIYRSLNVSTHFELVGGSSVEDHGKYVYEQYVGDMPHVADDDFITRINEVVEKHHIAYIMPAHDDVVVALATAQAEGKLSCPVVTSPVDTCLIARSKSKTYEHFASVVPTPKVLEEKSLDESNFPVFLKPDIGQGSKGTHIAHNAQEVSFYSQLEKNLLVLEYLPGKEFTVDCFTDKEGKLIYVQGRERRRIQNGISVDSLPVNDQKFHSYAESINNHVKIRGAWFFQLKERKDGELVLLEIAPRIAGTMGLSRGLGVNLPLLSLFDAEGLSVSVRPNSYDLEIDRALENRYRHNIYYRHVYLDFDDLVIINGKVNPSVMAFVYQCINNGITIHLLTRHREVLQDTLKRHRLMGIFPELIQIAESDEKTDYITEKDAIFIDDSFAERQKVQAKHGIPVFDGHMLEVLMEK